MHLKCHSMIHAKVLNISDPDKCCPLGLIAAVLCRGILDSLTKE